MSIITKTPTTLVTGFLGAGKTTFINTLLAHKGEQKWAILVNEFGKIGIDGKLFDSQDIAVKEVSGGCICCVSQLPLQIAIVRLLAEHQPAHLIIEPTGLAHADELIEQLSEAHWQTSLTLNAVICILSAAQWAQEKYRTHDGYIAHVKYADIIITNRADTLSDTDKVALRAWITTINPNANIIDMATSDDGTLTHCLHQPRATTVRPATIALAPTLRAADSDETEDTAPPYRYHETMADYHVGGWRLPKDWVFDGHQLQKWLLNLPDYARIKGVIHTSEGWIRLNITPDSITVGDTHDQDDSRLELILTDDIDWQKLDTELMALITT